MSSAIPGIQASSSGSMGNLAASDANDYLQEAKKHCNAKGIPQDLHGITLLEKAINLGNAEAMHLLALAYMDGSVVEQNSALCSKWLHLSAEKGSSAAMGTLGCAYDPDFNNQTYGCKPDYSIALYWYTQGAENGDRDAMRHLAMAYSWGSGVLKDEKKAAEWLIKAAEAGDVCSQSSLGLRYKTGNGVPIDKRESLKWYSKAGLNKHAKAAANAAYAHAMGEGTQQDFRIAMVWYRVAANLGEAEAMFCLANGYRLGRGVMQDENQAMNWYLKAANAGCKSAADAIADLQKSIDKS